MATSRESEKSGTKRYMDAYARLTNVLTNMYATERRAMDASVLYSVVMDLVIKGQDAEAVEIAKTFRDEKGDAWRESAFGCGLLTTNRFVNEV